MSYTGLRPKNGDPKAPSALRDELQHAVGITTKDHIISGGALSTAADRVIVGNTQAIIGGKYHEISSAEITIPANTAGIVCATKNNATDSVTPVVGSYLSASVLDTFFKNLLDTFISNFSSFYDNVNTTITFAASRYCSYTFTGVSIVYNKEDDGDVLTKNGTITSTYGRLGFASAKGDGSTGYYVGSTNSSVIFTATSQSTRILILDAFVSNGAAQTFFSDGVWAVGCSATNALTIKGVARNYQLVDGKPYVIVATADKNSSRGNLYVNGSIVDAEVVYTLLDNAVTSASNILPTVFSGPAGASKSPSQIAYYASYSCVLPYHVISKLADALCIPRTRQVPDVSYPVISTIDSATYNEWRGSLVNTRSDGVALVPIAASVRTLDYPTGSYLNSEGELVPSMPEYGKRMLSGLCLPSRIEMNSLTASGLYTNGAASTVFGQTMPNTWTMYFVCSIYSTVWFDTTGTNGANGNRLYFNINDECVKFYNGTSTTNVTFFSAQHAKAYAHPSGFWFIGVSYNNGTLTVSINGKVGTATVTQNTNTSNPLYLLSMPSGGKYNNIQYIATLQRASTDTEMQMFLAPMMALKKTNVPDVFPKNTIVIGYVKSANSGSIITDYSYGYGRVEGAVNGNRVAFLGWKKVTAVSTTLTWDNPFGSCDVNARLVKTKYLGNPQISGLYNYYTYNSSFYGWLPITVTTNTISTVSAATDADGLPYYVGCWAEVIE